MRITMLLSLIFTGFLLSSSSHRLHAQEESPYYFADETLERDESMRKARTLHKGPRTFTKEKPDTESPEYRKKRSPLDQLKYLSPGSYEAKIIGILCNACTDAVLANLKTIKQVEKASFDYEEGILKFGIKKPKKAKKDQPSKSFFDRDKPLRYSKFRRAVRRAGRRVRLNTSFTISEIKKIK